MGRKIEKTGVVVSDKMDKTRVVMVEYTTHHPLYKKTTRKRKKFYAHDQENVTKVGDVVKIIQTRPLSKLKRWEIIEVMEKGSKKNGTTSDNVNSSG